MARGLKIFNSHNPRTGQRKSGRLKRLFIFLLPLLVVGAAAFGFLQMKKLKPKPETKTEPPRAAPVLTAIAQTSSVQLSVHTQGEVRPRAEISLAAQIGGKINYVSPNFLEGAQFNKGDVLLRLESTDYDLRVTQSQANVAQAQTVLTRELSEADIARLDWEDLGEGKATPLSLRQPQVAEARAKLAAANAALQEAMLGQSRTAIYAPFDGRIREKTVAIGAYISPGQKLGQIYGVSIADVKLSLTDADLAKLGLGIGFKASRARPGPHVIFSATIAGESHIWHGIITRTDSGYDSATRILYAYAEVKDPYGKGSDNGTPFASGLYVDAKIAGRDIETSIVVPRNALRGTDRVFVANNDGTLSIRTVKILSSSRDQVVIASGLDDGETVITSPVRGVAEGMKIEIAKPSTNQVSTEN